MTESPGESGDQRHLDRQAVFEKLRQEIRKRLIRQGNPNPSDNRIEELLVQDPRYKRLLEN
jgi:hypothetical protein